MIYHYLVSFFHDSSGFNSHLDTYPPPLAHSHPLYHLFVAVDTPFPLVIWVHFRSRSNSSSRLLTSLDHPPCVTPTPSFCPGVPLFSPLATPIIINNLVFLLCKTPLQSQVFSHFLRSVYIA